MLCDSHRALHDTNGQQIFFYICHRVLCEILSKFCQDELSLAQTSKEDWKPSLRAKDLYGGNCRCLGLSVITANHLTLDIPRRLPYAILTFSSVVDKAACQYGLKMLLRNTCWQRGKNQRYNMMFASWRMSFNFGFILSQLKHRVFSASAQRL